MAVVRKSCSRCRKNFISEKEFSQHVCLRVKTIKMSITRPVPCQPKHEAIYYETNEVVTVGIHTPESFKNGTFWRLDFEWFGAIAMVRTIWNQSGQFRMAASLDHFIQYKHMFYENCQGYPKVRFSNGRDLNGSFLLFEIRTCPDFGSPLYLNGGKKYDSRIFMFWNGIWIPDLSYCFWILLL